MEQEQNKIEKICSILRQETLEPAEQKALAIVHEAEKQAEEIVLKANQRADEIILNALKKIEQEKKVFQISLLQAAKQGVEFLKQEIEEKLFQPELESIIKKESSDPKLISKILNTIVERVEKEGISKNLEAFIPKDINPEAINRLIFAEILKKLKDHSVSLGEFAGGVQIKLIDKKMTIDMSDQALKELFTQYLRKDFRKLIFNQ